MECRLLVINGPLLTTLFLVFNIVVGASALQCYQCGLYNDGVGSITPCINYTAEKHLKECPGASAKYCIKYVSEGSEVRDCIDKCKEVESWGTKIYCCQEDGCNSASVPRLPVLLCMAGALVLVARRLLPAQLA